MFRKGRIADIPVKVPSTEKKWQEFLRELSVIVDRNILDGIDELVSNLDDAEQTLIDHIGDDSIHFEMEDIALTADQITTGVISFDRLPISEQQVQEWDEAFGWGDHAEAGYAQEDHTHLPADILAVREAEEAISALRAVVTTDQGTVALADLSDESHFGKVLGISVTSASSGSPVTVQLFGELVDSSWSWTPQEWIFVGDNGQLTQQIPEGPWIQVMGHATSTTSVEIKVREPTILENN